MKFLLVVFKIVILINIVTCEMETTYRSRLANRRQQKLIEGAMDLKADPCEDFSQYACGNWENVHREASDRYLDLIQIFNNNANKFLARVFNRINLRYKPKFVKNTYEYYKSCKDWKIYEPLEYLKWIKENGNSNWPILWTPSKTPVAFNWLNTLAIMRIYGLNNIFIEENVSRMREDPSKYIIYLQQPDEDEAFRALSYERLALLVESTGVLMRTKAVLKLWYEIRDFELKLIALDDIVAEGDEEEFRLTTFKDLPLPWLKEYLRIILNQTAANPDMEIYIQDVPYMMALDELLKNYSQQFLHEYLEIQFLVKINILRPLDFNAIYCVSSARGFLPTAMNWIYEQQHPELKREFPKIMTLFQNLRKHLNKAILNNNNGFDSSVVEYLSAKLNNMTLKINNIPRKDTVYTLENFYKTLNLNASEFYANQLKLLKFNFESKHNLLKPTISQNNFFYLENWKIGASSWSYFLEEPNILVLPLTLLQQPMYHVDVDDIFKYSSLAFMVAIDILYGLDVTDLKFHHKGKTDSHYYEAIITNPLYNASLNCSSELNRSRVNYVSALRLAYQIFLDSYPDAVAKYNRINGRDVPLGKLFFLNLAQIICRSSNFKDYVRTTIDGTYQDRTVDALAYFPEFLNAFQCTTKNETCYI